MDIELSGLPTITEKKKKVYYLSVETGTFWSENAVMD